MTTRTIRTSGARRAARLLAVPALAALTFGTGACSADDATSAAEETVAESVSLAAESDAAPIAQGADPGAEEHSATGADVEVSVRGYVQPGLAGRRPHGGGDLRRRRDHDRRHAGVRQRRAIAGSSLPA